MSGPVDRERKMKAAGMLDVTWRSASAFRAAETAVEFSFETACGAALRLRMPKSSARLLHASLGEALGGYAADHPSSVSGAAREIMQTLADGINAGPAPAPPAQDGRAA